MQLTRQRDFFAGLVFSCAGITAVWASKNYRIGTAAEMGPGYFPMMLGVLLAVIGAVITFNAIVAKRGADEKIGPFAWKPLFFIIGANLVFGIMLDGLPSIKLPAMGLIAGIYALTFLASLAGEEFKLKEVIILATVLALICFVAFTLLLKLPYPLWPAFITN